MIHGYVVVVNIVMTGMGTGEQCIPLRFCELYQTAF